MQKTIGVDVGNFDTKTANTTTVSGFTMYDNEQLLAEDVLAYGGKFYVESIDSRLPFVEDKTLNDQCLILTLFSIAKQILWIIKEEEHYVGNGIQDEILKYNEINLAIGLPPGHFNKLAMKTAEYYRNKMKNGISFKYGNYKFSFKTCVVEVYAQDLSAVLLDKTLTITKPPTDDNGKKLEVPKYYIVGIGGYTVDIIPTINNKPEVDKCRSLPLGTRPMFETIIARIQSSSGITLNECDIETVLRGKRNYIKPDVVEEIKRNAELHAKQIIDRCIQAGCSLDINPVVYVGGGCKLLKPYLEKNDLVCYSEYIEDTHANAKNYEDFLKMKLKRKA